ncbi:putative retinol dehydrogenase 12 isoform X2 [Sesbania bispinosa]|nr:putative retinol dehydrogenase 12 isoform X2 [Sesbania bispinosa]
MTDSAFEIAQDHLDNIFQEALKGIATLSAETDQDEARTVAEDKMERERWWSDGMEPSSGGATGLRPSDGGGARTVAERRDGALQLRCGAILAVLQWRCDSILIKIVQGGVASFSRLESRTQVLMN